MPDPDLRADDLQEALVKRFLKQVPGASAAYHHARFFSGLVYEGWLANRRKLFDRLLAAGAKQSAAGAPKDPSVGRLWDFETPFNLERYERALAATAAQMGGRSWGDALELGCGTGVFTARLADRCRAVHAVDISTFGCERTRERCSSRDNVQVDRFDLRKDSIAGDYDLVFAMDVLEYFHGVRATRLIATKLAHAVRSQGYLVVTATRLPEKMRHSRWALWLIEGGDAIADFLDGKHGLQKVHRDLYAKYLVAVFQKTV